MSGIWNADGLEHVAGSRDRSLPGMLRMSGRCRHDILEHLERSRPNEGVGLLAVARATDISRQTTDLDVVRFYPGTNADASASRFTMEPAEVIVALRDIDERGWRLGAIIHSHPLGPASPSPTDLREARYPAALMLIVSFASLPPDMAAWWIDDSNGHPITVRVPIHVS